jgi:hypothetical protein
VIQVEFAPDLGPNSRHLVVTLSAEADTLTTVGIPNGARGVVITPVNNPVRVDVNEAPAATEAASSSTTVAASAWGLGAICEPDIPNPRILPDGTGRTLQIRSSSASVVVRLSTF